MRWTLFVLLLGFGCQPEVTVWDEWSSPIDPSYGVDLNNLREAGLSSPYLLGGRILASAHRDRLWPITASFVSSDLDVLTYETQATVGGERFSQVLFPRREGRATVAIRAPDEPDILLGDVEVVQPDQVTLVSSDDYRANGRTLVGLTGTDWIGIAGEWPTHVWLKMEHQDRVVSGTGRLDLEFSEGYTVSAVDGQRFGIGHRELDVEPGLLRVSNAGREIARIRVEHVRSEDVEWVELVELESGVVAQAFDARGVRVLGCRFAWWVNGIVNRYTRAVLAVPPGSGQITACVRGRCAEATR